MLLMAMGCGDLERLTAESREYEQRKAKHTQRKASIELYNDFIARNRRLSAFSADVVAIYRSRGPSQMEEIQALALGKIDQIAKELEAFDPQKPEGAAPELSEAVDHWKRELLAALKIWRESVQSGNSADPALQRSLERVQELGHEVRRRMTLIAPDLKEQIGG